MSPFLRALPFSLLLIQQVPSCESTDVDGDEWTVDDGDCNDNDASVYPGASEVCDGQDNNCDATIDEGVQVTYYQDLDGDGYGSSASSLSACSQPEGYVENSSDCNDSSASVEPGSVEIANEVDDNCDGMIDEGLTCTASTPGTYVYWFSGYSGSQQYSRTFHGLSGDSHSIGTLSGYEECLSYGIPSVNVIRDQNGNLVDGEYRLNCSNDNTMTITFLDFTPDTSSCTR